MSIQIWFYKPTTAANRFVNFFRPRPFVHCGVAHNIAELAMYTDVRTTGVVPQPARYVKAPDAVVTIAVDSYWVSQWLFKKWLVRVPWHDRIMPAHESAPDKAVYDFKKITSAGLVAHLVIDAAKDQATSDRSLVDQIALASLNPSRLGVSLLYAAVAPKSAD